MPTLTVPRPPKWFFASYGMGRESTAWIHKLLTAPQTYRPPEILPDYSNLIVATAQTGDEWSYTGELVTEHILPLLRRNNVRFVEVARKGPTKADGIAVLQDTRSPVKLHLEGVYKLSDENRESGTMPILSGHHECAQKSKGAPLDWWRAQELGDDPYYHMIGYNVDEQSRIKKDKGYAMGGQRWPVYPLSDWGMTRAECTDYLTMMLDLLWTRSCCRQCPYINTEGWPEQLKLWVDRPREAMQHLVDEYVALTLNPRSGLYGPGKSLIGKLQRHGAAEVLSLAYKRMTAVPWALYRVRRRYNAPAVAPRSVQKLMTGKRMSMLSMLTKIADYSGIDLSRDEEIKGAPKKIRDVDNIPRLWVKRRTEGAYPTLEEFFVAAPAQANEKARPSFEKNWTDLVHKHLARRERTVGCAVNVAASMAGDTRRRDPFGVVLTEEAA